MDKTSNNICRGDIYVTFEHLTDNVSGSLGKNYPPGSRVFEETSRKSAKSQGEKMSLWTRLFKNRPKHKKGGGSESMIRPASLLISTNCHYCGKTCIAFRDEAKPMCNSCVHRRARRRF